MQQFMCNIAKIQKDIKRKVTSDLTQLPITPNLKQSPKTPASGKKAKYSFPTKSKGKRLLPKTPKKTKSYSAYKTSQKTADKSSEELASKMPFADTVRQSPWKRPSQLARESIRKIKRQTRLQQKEQKKEEGLKQSALRGATKGILKKLQAAPGWKPFGTPLKRKLDGKDW